MGYTVRLEPAGREFTVAEDETILVAAERQGQRLSYGCRHGRCSSCKYRMLEGDVEQPDASNYCLSDAEREEGWALVCCAYPVEDLVLEDETEPDRRGRPMLLPTEHTGVVTAVEPVGGDLWQVEVSRPEGLGFYAGQFFELEAVGRTEVWRPYSAASAPEDEDRLAFLIKKMTGGAFSGAVDADLVGATLGLRGPFGDAYLRDGDADVVLVATGSGIAPLRSIISHAAAVGDDRRFHLLYGSRRPDAMAVVRSLEAFAVDLHVTVCVSQPDGAWTGPTGRVTQAVQRLVGDASTIDAYLCGHPDMCAQVTLLLEAKGIGERNLFSDPFFSSAAPDAGAG